MAVLAVVFVALPVSTGRAAVRYVAEVFASGLDGPVGLVFDTQGNLYVANEGEPPASQGSTISIIDENGQIDIFAVGFTGPSGLDMNSSGEIYVSDDTDAVYKVEDGIGTWFVDIWGNPNAIVFDEQDNLYVAPHGDDTVYRISPDKTILSFASGFVYPHGLTFDDDGFLYVSNAGCISKVAPDGAIVDPVFASIPSEGLAFGPTGNPTEPRALFAVAGDGIYQVDDYRIMKTTRLDLAGGHLYIHMQFK